MNDCQSPLSLFVYLFSDSCINEYAQPPQIGEFDFLFYLVAFIFNLMCETPFYLFILRKYASLARICLASLSVNLATHPFVFLALPRMFAHYEVSYAHYALFAETLVPIVEFWMIWKVFKFPFRQALIASLSANLFSWLIGGSIFVKLF